MRTIHLACATILLCGLFASVFGTALAMPGMASSGSRHSFTALDANGDGKISPEEFFNVFTSMKEAAFGVIDKDKSGDISETEWNNFFSSHAKTAQTNSTTGSAAPGMKNNGTAKTTPPLIMPPKQ